MQISWRILLRLNRTLLFHTITKIANFTSSDVIITYTDLIAIEIADINLTSKTTIMNTKAYL